MVYICEGRSKPSTTKTTVTSRISSLTYAVTPSPKYYLHHPQDVDYHFILLLEALDNEGNGVPGKGPQKLEIATKSESAHEVLIQIMEFDSAFKVSQDDGIISVPVKIGCIAKEQTVTLKFTVDGNEATSVPIYLDKPRQYNLKDPAYF